MDRKVSGYTIMELLVIIAILSILAGFFLYPMLVQVARERLRAGMTQFASDLNQVKLRSISTGSMWGIRVCGGNGQYKVFIDHDMNCRDVNPNCTSIDTTRVCSAAPNATCSDGADCLASCDNNSGRCVNAPNVICNTANDCPPSTGPCLQRERLISFPTGVAPGNDFYVVFDRRGYVLNYSCGFGAGTLTLRNFLGEERRVILDRLGRVRYE